MSHDVNVDEHRRRFLKIAGPAGVVALAGCAGDEEPEDTETDTPEETPEPTEEPDEDEPAAEPEPTQLRIAYDTHFHGRLGDVDDARNVANYFGLAESVLDDAPGHTMMLGGGDDLHMSVMSSVYDGQHVVDVFNESPLTHNTFGNHEFDTGPEVARDAVAESEFVWLSANLLDERTGDAFAAEEGARRYAIEEVGDATVALTGLVHAGAPEVTSLGDNAEVVDPVEAAEDVIADIEAAADADVVIMMSHLASPAAEDLVAEVDGFDVVVADHAAFVNDEVLEENDTLLSFVGDELDHLGQLDLEIADGGIVDYEFAMHDVVELAEDGEIDPHEGIADIHADYAADLDEELGEVIGETTVDIDVTRETVRQEESGFASYIADVIREDVDADVAIQNGGGVRSDRVYNAGDLTRRTVVDILPFPNDTCSLELSGEGVRAAIEHGVGQIDELDGRFPQVSGMSYAYDPDAPEGDRVEEITVDGEPIDDEETYVVATNDFMLGGGDGYEMFAEADVVRPPDEGQLLSAAVTFAIEADEVISPEPDGRVEVR